MSYFLNFITSNLYTADLNTMTDNDMTPATRLVTEWQDSSRIQVGEDKELEQTRSMRINGPRHIKRRVLGHWYVFLKLFSLIYYHRTQLTMKQQADEPVHRHSLLSCSKHETEGFFLSYSLPTPHHHRLPPPLPEMQDGGRPLYSFFHPCLYPHTCLTGRGLVKVQILRPLPLPTRSYPWPIPTQVTIPVSFPILAPPM